MTWLYVAAGAALGAPLRYLAGHLLDGLMPWGTVLVNVVGAFLLGVGSGLAWNGAAWALGAVGFCGALTTFSAFAVQTHDRGPALGLLNVLMTVPAVVGACTLGFLVAT